MSTIGKRLKLIRKHKGMTQKQLAEMLKVTENYIYRLENDKRNIQENTIEILKLNLNINKDWLMTGNGEMFIDPLEGIEASEHLKVLCRKIMDLPQDQQDKVLKMIDTFLE